MNEKISIVIPIYQVEQYLRQCLDSIVQQTYQNLEILLIDDGSPDRCGAICDEYAARDSRFRVLHKKNAGVHAAWNDGLKAATGEWIAFVDSDDWIESSYFAALVADSRAAVADIIISNGYFREENRGQTVRKAFIEPFFFDHGSGKDYLQIRTIVRPKDARTKGTLGYIWGKLYRASFIRKEGLGFNAGIAAGMMGDTLFNFDAYQRADFVLGVDYSGYHYRVTDSSGTGRFYPDRVKRQEFIEEELYRRVEQYQSSSEVRLALESHCLRDIAHNLERFYFHPDNPASKKEVAAGIKEMKQMPCYSNAIHSPRNPYNNMSLEIFKRVLRLPWVWPLRWTVRLWNYVDQKEKKA